MVCTSLGSLLRPVFNFLRSILLVHRVDIGYKISYIQRLSYHPIKTLALRMNLALPPSLVHYFVLCEIIGLGL